MKFLLLASLTLVPVHASILSRKHYVRIPESSLSARSQMLDIDSGLEALMNQIERNITLSFARAHLSERVEQPSDVLTSADLGDLPALAKRQTPPELAKTVNLPDEPPPGALWDESFANEPEKRAVVKTAWREAMRLASMSADGLSSLQINMQIQDPSIDPSISRDSKRNFIAKQSPPMAQMFGSDPGLIGRTQSVFQNMIDLLPDVKKKARRGVNLRLVYGDKIRKSYYKKPGRKVCERQGSQDITYAVTFNPHVDTEYAELQQKYLLRDAIIVFCPEFFLVAPDVNALTNDLEAQQQHYMLDRLRTQGQTVLHEWTHLDWIGQTVDAPGPDGVDTYGYTRTAELYDTTHVDNQGERWGGENVVKNADNYAVFASYHAYNQEPWAPPDGRAGFGCKDVWPRNPLDVAIFQPPKPAKDSFP